MELKNKKILLVGLGILGGGLSMANFLIRKSAKLTITDLRTRKDLEKTIKKLPRNIKYTLGKHSKEDFQKADIIIFNQAVSAFSPWVKLAQKLKKEYYSDYTFFLAEIEKINSTAKIIGITGTRGKTTTTIWANHLIPGSVLGGNIPDKNLLKISSKKTDCFVLELSSFQLEYANEATKSPKIAVITNIYRDHLNRYENLGRYKEIKFNIFKNQSTDDFLILNDGENITKEVLKRKPKSKICFVSTKRLSASKNGLYFIGNNIYFQENKTSKKVASFIGLARFEKANLLCAMLAAHLAGTSWTEIKSRIKNLPSAPLRQQVIFDNGKLTIINDSAGTSPEATIAAIEKYKDRDDFVLICGGTDKKLDFSDLVKEIKENIHPNNLYLLSGSGTEKIKKALTTVLYSTKVEKFDSLEKIVQLLAQRYKTGTIVFSPGCASFEKFKNEFDRGEQFNKFVKKYFK